MPKGKKRGTDKECLEANQVRYYGIKAIKKSSLDKHQNEKEGDKKREEIKFKLLGIRSKTLALKKKYARENSRTSPNKDKLKEYVNEMEKLKTAYFKLKELEEKYAK